MNSAPQLLREDRPEFERVLDEALRTAHHRPDLAALGRRLNADQVRALALGAATAIAACAASEYQQYVHLREELRRRRTHAPAHIGAPGHESAPESEPAALPEPAEETAGPLAPGERMSGLAGAMGGEGLAEASGAGLVAVVSVLAPVLAATAALIFLLLGYALRLMSPEPAVAGPMRTTGWVFAALAAAAFLLAMGGLLLAALRNGSRTARPHGAGGGVGGTDGYAPGVGEHGHGGRDGYGDEVAQAHAAWREALLERGIVPFLHDVLTDPHVTGRAPAPYDQPDEERPAELPEQRPSFGYSQPDFSSRPASETPGEPGPRPRYTSPDYSSPEYDGPGLGGSDRTA